MGAWIEISGATSSFPRRPVAPYMGAWIEIHQIGNQGRSAPSRTLHGCVD